MYSFEGNRVVRDTGAKYPIFNAPIGYFARAQLAGAVSAAGGMGLLEMNSSGIDETATEYDKIRSRTDAPFGLHMFLQVLVAQNRVDEVLDWALGRTTFMASCAGNPARVMPRLNDAGIKLYHQVGTLDQALKAADAGVDGLIVEGAESGGLRGANGPHLFSLLQQVRARVDLPLVAAGGIVDGHGMAGAFALGAEGVLMGTRFMSAVESPAHQNWKQAIADCDRTLSIDPGRSATRMLVVRNEFSEAVARGEIDPKGNPYAGPFHELFKNGRLDKAMAGCGESAILVTSIRAVAEIIDETIRVFWQEIERLGQLLPSGARSTP